MKNLMLYVLEDVREQAVRSIRPLLDLQVENSLDLGWHRDQLVLYTNFPYHYLGVSAREIAPPQRPKTARATSFYKTFCLLDALERAGSDEVVWYHDVDAFQLTELEPPSPRELAFCLYSTRQRLLVQGGSLFIRPSARPIFEQVFARLHEGCRKDEFALTDLTGRPELSGSFEVLDYSYNLGTTDFELRYQVAARPIRVTHFHPERPEHRAIFVEGRNMLGVVPLDVRFLALLDKHVGPRPPAAARRPWFPLRWLQDPVRLGAGEA